MSETTTPIDETRARALGMLTAGVPVSQVVEQTGLAFRKVARLAARIVTFKANAACDDDGDILGADHAGRLERWADRPKSVNATAHGERERKRRDALKRKTDKLLRSLGIPTSGIVLPPLARLDLPHVWAHERMSPGRPKNPRRPASSRSRRGRSTDGLSASPGPSAVGAVPPSHEATE